MAVETVVHSMTFERAWAVCQRFESANEISSAEFLARYRRGQVDPTPAAMRWISTFETMLRLAPQLDDMYDLEDIRIPA